MVLREDEVAERKKVIKELQKQAALKDAKTANAEAVAAVASAMDD